MKNPFLINALIVLIGLVCAVMIIYPLTMLVLGSMALPNIIVGVIFGALLLAAHGFIIWMYVTE